MASRTSREDTYFLGIDVGTTSVKAVLYNPRTGQVEQKAAHPTPTEHPRPDWAHWDPEALWNAVVHAVREVVAPRNIRHRVAGIGIASVGEAGLPLDAAGTPLYPIIAWFDPRGEEQVQRWRAEHDLRALYRVTGHTPRAIYTLFKILWLRDHHPEVVQRMRSWLFVGDYIAYRLTGEVATVPTLAARSYMFDVVQRGWSPAILEEAGLRSDQLPPVQPTTLPVGQVTEGAARALGVAAGIPVALGGHDHVVGMWVAGITLPGRAVDSSGTAQAVAVHLPQFVGDAGYEVRMTCYPFVVGDGYILQGGMPTAGAALQWLADLLAQGDVDLLLRWAETAPPGSHGVGCVPFLRGAGSPYGRSDVRALFYHLDLSTGRADMARALVEGLACFLADIVQHMERITAYPVQEIRAIGGSNRSDFLLRVKSTMLGLPVVRVDVPEAVGVGAALLAGVAAGYFASAEEALASVYIPEVRVLPHQEWRAAYRHVFWKYQVWVHATLTASGESGPPG